MWSSTRCLTMHGHTNQLFWQVLYYTVLRLFSDSLWSGTNLFLLLPNIKTFPLLQQVINWFIGADQVPFFWLSPRVSAALCCCLAKWFFYTDFKAGISSPSISIFKLNPRLGTKAESERNTHAKTTLSLSTRGPDLINHDEPLWTRVIRAPINTRRS